MATSRIRNGRKKWIGRYTDETTNRRTAKEFGTRKDALAWEVEMRMAQGELKSMPLQAFVNSYLRDCEARLSGGKGGGNYKDKVRAFDRLIESFTPNTDIRGITYHMMSSHIHTLADQMTNNRANRDRDHVVAAWNWGVRAYGLSAVNPWKVDKLRAGKHRLIVPTNDEFWRVYDSTGDEQYRRLLIAFLNTAARKEELLSLKWDDVDFENRRLSLTTTKRRRGPEIEKIQMTEDLHEVLLIQLEESPKDCGFVFFNRQTGTRFTSLSKMMNRLCDKAGVRRFGFHGIRHLSASMLCSAGISTKAIQGLLRHKRITTTDSYLHRLNGPTEDLNGVFSRD